MKGKKEIFKVQVDFSGESVLIYNKDRSAMIQLEAGEDFKQFPPGSKHFIYGKLIGDNIHLGEFAPEQAW